MLPWAPRAQTACRQISTSLELNSSRPGESRFGRPPTYNDVMARHEEFTHIEPGLRPILEELRSREPIFHTRAFGTTRADFEAVMAPDYWEVGASGRRCGREFILRLMDQNPPVDAAAAGWRSEDCGVRRLGPNTYLFTYPLCQAEWITRRATIWEHDAKGWRILYHQGTIVSSGGDDIA